MNLYGLPSPIFFFFTAHGGALNYTCLTCCPTSSGFYWSPFSSLKFDLEVAFSFYIFTENIKTGDRTVGRVDLHTRRLDLQHLLAFLSDPASPMTKHASVSRNIKLIPFVMGGVSYSSMVYI